MNQILVWINLQVSFKITYYFGSIFKQNNDMSDNYFLKDEDKMTDVTNVTEPSINDETGEFFCLKKIGN